MSATDLQRQFYDMLMRSQFWSAERMQEHQRSQLEQLLRHAKRNVPFYGTRLDAVLRPGGEINWQRWQELPILNRADLRDHRGAMRARELPPGHGDVLVASSSGSTGEPILASHNALVAIAGDAALARAHTWHEVDFGATFVNLIGDDPAVAAWPEGRSSESWAPQFLRLSHPGPKHELNAFATVEQQIAFIERYRPAYLGGLTSRLKAVAIEAQRQSIALPIRTVMTFGEAVPASVEELFAEAFGAKVLAQYSAQETHKIAISCPQSGHYHINSEVMLVEIVDDAGHAVPAGARGRVLVTSFFNTAQPLIRYQIGDLAVAGDRCACGRTLPVLTEISGRIAHLFRLADGRSVLPIVSDDLVTALGIRSWQLAQVAIDRAEFRYIPGEMTTDEEELRAVVRSGLDPMIDLAMRRVERIGAGGKHIPYVSELSPQVQ